MLGRRKKSRGKGEKKVGGINNTIISVVGSCITEKVLRTVRAVGRMIMVRVPFSLEGCVPTSDQDADLPLRQI